MKMTLAYLQSTDVAIYKRFDRLEAFSLNAIALHKAPVSINVRTD